MKVFLLLVLGASIGLAQTPIPTTKLLDFNRHIWVSYSGDHNVRGKWGIHLEAQYRFSDFGARSQQTFARPAVNYRLSPKILLTAGYAYLRTFPYGDFPGRGIFPEHRIYQQVRYDHKAGSTRVQHRFRLEQRFLEYPNGREEWTYQNRFRYMLKTDFPIGRTSEGTPGKWYIPVWNEILLGIPPNIGARTFDQNRLFAGIGRQLPGRSNIEVGYLNQFLGQRNGRVFEFNNTLFVSLGSTFAFGK